MKRRLAVLGGSSPFTVALVDALEAQAPGLPPHALVLQGRNAEALRLVDAYATHRLEPLGWEVSHLHSLDAALDGADVVVHQVRYGDMAGRDADERLARELGVTADETLGPGGLLGGLRAAAPVAALGERIAAGCPDAWVLNLTNPLSVVTSLLAVAGSRRCVGLCELPAVTARQAACALGLPAERVEWTYAGLNHRGFICSLSVDGRDRLPELPAALGAGSLGGIDGGTIAELGALPLKYFALYEKRGPAQPGRAAFLDGLRTRILHQLRDSVAESPAALRERYVGWYADAVVPMIVALCSPAPRLLAVNVPGPDGVVDEVQAWVAAAGTERVTPPPVSPAAGAWIERFRRHEKAVLAAVARPDAASVAEAVHADPIIPPARAARVAQAVWAHYDGAARPAPPFYAYRLRER